MTEERVRRLDPEALELFATKGCEGGRHVPQSGADNGLKVRRIMQITRDFARRPMAGLRIIDLGCGEGAYAIEAGLRGAEVLALDARTQRMAKGADCAARHDMSNVRFVQDDVRRASRETVGTFDVVYLLGLLYHLDSPDVFTVLENVHGLCAGMLVIDTLVSLSAEMPIEWRGQRYEASRCREHEDGDADEVRRNHVLRSIDNTFSVRFTRGSLLRVLHDVGFTSVYECHVPVETGKAEDRITLVAIKGNPVLLSTYPWVNGKSETEIERIVRVGDPGAHSIDTGKGKL